MVVAQQATGGQMAKRAKINQRKKAQAAKLQAAPAEPLLTRRGMLSLARNGAIGAALLAGGGYAGTRMYGAYKAEHDLTRIGKGKPVVVQVHDPQCPTCTALQRETRKAMKQFGECDVVYLVADIKQPEGQVFAAKHNVPHVTLVLMDGDGIVTQVLRGMRYRDELRTILGVHFEAYGAKA